MTGQRQFIDKAREGQARAEQNEQGSSEAHEGPLSPQKVAEFHAVTSAMEAVLAGTAVETVARNLTPAQQAALDNLYMAKAARDPDTEGFVSGVERKQGLEQALACLRPILMLGARPDFRNGQRVYADLASKVNGVRKEIVSAIGSQIMPPPKKKKAADEASDEAGDDAADGAGDEPVPVGGESGGQGRNQPEGQADGVAAGDSGTDTGVGGGVTEGAGGRGAAKHEDLQETGGD